MTQPRTYAIQHQWREFPIIEQMVVGRSPVCDLVLNKDQKVSRQHARLSVHEEGVLLEDLQSANGVYVNGTRIQSRSGLNPRDLLQVGAQQLRLVQSSLQGSQSNPTKRATLPVAPSDRFEPSTPRQEGVAAMDWKPLCTAISENNLNRAAQLLRVAFDRTLEEATAGGRLAEKDLEAISTHAAALAARTRDGFWLNMLFHLHVLLAKPLPHATVAMLPQLVHRVRGLDTIALEAYVNVLRNSRANLTAVQRRMRVALESSLLIASARFGCSSPEGTTEGPPNLRSLSRGMGLDE